MSSTSSTTVLVAAEPAHPEVVVDPLQQFADSHYESLCSAVEKRNGGYFHECCFAFSTRRFALHSGHPTATTIRVSKLFKQHNIKTRERFVEVLRELLAASAVPNPPPAPLLNHLHPQPQDLGKRSPIPEPPQPDLLDLQDQLAALQDQLRQEQERSQHLEAQLAACDAQNNQLRFWLGWNSVDYEAVLTGTTPTDYQSRIPVAHTYPETLPTFPVPPRSHPRWLEFCWEVKDGHIRSEEELNRFIASLPPLHRPRRSHPPN